MQRSKKTTSERVLARQKDQNPFAVSENECANMRLLRARILRIFSWLNLRLEVRRQIIAIPSGLQATGSQTQARSDEEEE
ncbi:MAG: hypothetical protein DMF64_09185 [Acidobacteria bacterium]|nr:MAG: hypothetical protein DMF64_09185 [Acidobacteriota bacterium]